MNRWIYKLESVLAAWISIFILMGLLLVGSVSLDMIDSSYREAIWDALKFSSGGSLFLYIVSVLFYPMIKELNE